MKRNLSLRDLFLVLLLLILVSGIGYRAAFYLPLQKELAAVSTQTQALDEEITQKAARALRMDTMQKELDAFFRLPAQEQTEIPPFDNKAQVLSQLNRILASSEEYSLQFSEPVTDKGGTVRRSVRMHFRCADFSIAKAIVSEFTHCRYRCLISNLSISGSGNILIGPIEVSATVTFLESTKFSP